MKITSQIILILLFTTCGAFAQFTIGSNQMPTSSGTAISTNTDIAFGSIERNYGEPSWYLVGSDQQITSNTVRTSFYQLFIDGGGTKTFTGTFRVDNQLNLINGVVSIPADQQFGLTSPLVVGDHSSDSYVDGMLRINIGENGSAVYPVGNSEVYTPVELNNILGDNPTIGIDANSTGIGTISGLPTPVDNYSDKWFWELELFTTDNTFSAANITIPLLDDDKAQFGEDDYQPLVLYQNADGISSNLGNASGDAASRTDPSITSSDLGGKGFYYAGRTLAIEPIIHNIITPNGDNTNDYLVIDNLQFFPENEVLIIDRYGIEIFKTSNYLSPTSESADGQDFSFLSPGNYICILKFNNGESTIKQTLSVIK